MADPLSTSPTYMELRDDYSESMGAYTARLLNEAIKSARRRSKPSPRDSPMPQIEDPEDTRERLEKQQHQRDDEERTATFFAASRRRTSVPLDPRPDGQTSRRASAAPTMMTVSSRETSTTEDMLPRTPPTTDSDVYHFQPPVRPPTNTPVFLDGQGSDHLDDYYEDDDDEDNDDDDDPESVYIVDDAYDVTAVEDKLESLTLNQSHDGSGRGPLRSGRDLVDEHVCNVEAFKARERKRVNRHLGLETRSWSIG